MLCGEISQGCKCFVVKYYKTVDLSLSLPLWPWGWRSWWRSQLFLLLPVTSLSRDRTLLPCQLLASTPHICPAKKQSDVARLRWSKILEEGIRQTSEYVDKTRTSPRTFCQWEQTEIHFRGLKTTPYKLQHFGTFRDWQTPVCCHRISPDTRQEITKEHRKIHHSSETTKRQH